MYWADYLADTMHLTTEEHGVYLLLIAAYWRRARALPDDNKWLATVTKMSLKRWIKVRPKILEYFDNLEGLLIHERLELEIFSSNVRLRSARTAGIASAVARGQRTDQRVTLTKEVKKKEPLRGKKKESQPLPARGTRLPENWALPDEWRKWAIDQNLGNLASLSLEGERFRDYWCAKTGKDASKRDWFATWRNWMRKAGEIAQERRSHGHATDTGRTDEEHSPAALAKWRQARIKAEAQQEATSKPGKFRDELTPAQHRAFDRKIEKLRLTPDAVPEPRHQTARKQTPISMTPEEREAGLVALAKGRADE